MTEPPPDERVAEVIALAIQAAGPQPNAAAWVAKVGEMIPLVAMAFTPQSPQSKRASAILAARRIPGFYRGYRYEQSSTRCVITYELLSGPTKYSKDGTETVRTERTDTSIGKAQRELLDTIPEGAKVLVWVYTDKADRLADGDGVRTLAHLDVLDQSPRPGSGRSEERHAPAASPASEPEPADLPHRPAPADSQYAAQVAAASEGMTGKQLGQVAGACRAKGIENWRMPSRLEVERVLESIRNVKEAF